VPKRKINIDPTSFSIDITHPNGMELNKEEMSAGEQEVYAISVLWGLANATGHAIPMIIDTPLAKLDSNHVENTVTKFFPFASHQLILLSQDREIDEELYGRLSKWIDHSLTIDKGEKDKIREGYFFD
jgi:DNA sulfur modification protein DndD